MSLVKFVIISDPRFIHVSTFRSPSAVFQSTVTRQAIYYPTFPALTDAGETVYSVTENTATMENKRYIDFCDENVVTFLIAENGSLNTPNMVLI